MTEKTMLNKAEFGSYAQALLKNHNIIYGYGTDSMVHFPENSPAELLAHTIFSKDKTKLIIRRGSKPIGTIDLQTKRNYATDCKVVEVLEVSPEIEDLTPTSLSH